MQSQRPGWGHLPTELVRIAKSRVKLKMLLSELRRDWQNRHALKSTGLSYGLLGYLQGRGTQQPLGWTAMHYAASQGYQTALIYFLEQRVTLKWPVEWTYPLNARTQAGQTALHLAVDGDHEAVVEYLMSFIDYDTPDLQSNTIVDQCFRDRRRNMLRVIFNSRSRRHDQYDQLVKATRFLELAILNEDEEITHLVLDSGYDPIRLLLLKPESVQLLDERSESTITRLILDAMSWDSCSEDTHPLARALIHGRSDLVRLLFKNKIDNSTTIWKRLCPGCLTLRHGHTSVMDLLIEHGEDTTIGWHHSPIHCAVVSAHRFIAAYIERGFDLSTACSLHFAAAQASYWTYAVEDLITWTKRQDLQRNQRNREDWIVQRNQRKKEDWIDTCEILISHGANIFQRDKEGCSLLHILTHPNDLTMFLFFLNKGLRVSELDDSCKTPLHHAAKEGGLQQVIHLLKNGADVSAIDKEGMTPIEIARAEYGRLKSKIEAGGVRPYIRIPWDSDFYKYERYYEIPAKPLEIGIKAKYCKKIIKLCTQNILSEGVVLPDLPEVEQALANGTSPDKKIRDIPLLCLACRKGNFDAARLLLNAGASADIIYSWFTGEDFGCTLLRAAILENWDLELIRLILENGAKADEEWGHQMPVTPLVASALKGDVECARLLLVHGADPERPSYHTRGSIAVAVDKADASLIRNRAGDERISNVFRPRWYMVPTLSAEGIQTVRSAML